MLKIEYGRFFFIIFYAIFQFFYGQVVFAQKDACSDKLYIARLDVSGNNTTKTIVIKRELSFAQGDSVCGNRLPELLAESKANLEKTPLFNFVTITADSIGGDKLRVSIQVVERWYFIPLFRLNYADRNLNNWLKNRDWTRINIGGGFEKYNFRGHNENIGSFMLFGYDEQISFFYRNIYFDQKRKHGASVYFKYFKRKETPYIIADDSYLQIELEQEHAVFSTGIFAKYFYRAKPNEQHNIGISYETRRTADTLQFLNKEYFTSKNNETHFTFLRYEYEKDTRNSRVFPMSGYRVSIFAQKTGLGIFPENGINYLHVRPALSNHYHFHEKLSLANHIVLKKSFGSRQPFFLQNALGTDFNLRGFEYYVVHGQDFAVNNNSLNIEIIPRTVFTVNFLPLEKFNKIHFAVYGGPFWDMAYVNNYESEYARLNSLQNTFLYSGGFSLNLLSYYDALFRVDFSWNSLNEKHIFFHTEVPF